MIFLKKEEALSPTAFFLVLLPPIIFESGYNLHKVCYVNNFLRLSIFYVYYTLSYLLIQQGNFFTNIGSISVFAVIGTVINALVFGGGVYLLGIVSLVYLIIT